MSWIELQIVTSAELANEWSDIFHSFGAEAVTFQDAGNQPIFEPSPETLILWQKTIVTGLFSVIASAAKQSSPSVPPLVDNGTDELDCFAALAMTEEIEPLLELLKNKQINFQLNHIADENWERKCLEHFKPMQVGKRLWIYPGWYSPPDPGAINVLLDPGLAFGTGTHPTTQLCLAWLDENIAGNETVIDYGCGSGILAIAALKLGAKKVFAIDHDPQAIEATLLNAERNDIKTNLEVLLPHEFKGQQADILIANILAHPLIELASFFASHIKTSGKIVLSGILRGQTSEVLEAYNSLFFMEKPVYSEDWTRLSGTRK